MMLHSAQNRSALLVSGSESIVKVRMSFGCWQVTEVVMLFILHSDFFFFFYIIYEYRVIYSMNFYTTVMCNMNIYM